MKTADLLKNANEKGFRIELSNSNEYIGICMKKSTWHWFKVFEDIVFFDHSYNQINGKTMKGIKHRIKINTILGFYNS
jgi:hypothetical protein